MKPRKDNIRVSMELSVTAINKYLVDKVTRMTDAELLSNMHPSDAEYYSVSKRK